MNRLTKLTRTIFAGATAVVLALGIVWAQTTLQRPLNPQTGFSAGVTYVSGANPTSGVNGEVIICRDCAGDAGPELFLWDGINSTADSVGTNAIGASLTFEGATEDAFEVIFAVVDPTADTTFRLNSKVTAATIDVLDAGLPPLAGATVSLPDRESVGSVNVAPRFKTWFRTGPSFTSATPANTAGLPVTCATTGTQFVYGPAILGHSFELDLKGTQTLCALSWAAATGSRFTTDATTNEGFELTQGITDGAPGAFTVGVSPAFYLSVRFTVADIAETDMTYIGFRGVEAYDATTFATYADYYVIGIGDLADGGAGDFFTQSEIGGAGIAAVDLAETDWANTESHTLTVLISSGGVATAQIEGSAVSDAGAYTFTDTTIVVPFMYSINDVTGVANEIDLVFWESGVQ